MITLLSIIALGFFLGMRHATDPDHVIAVTTIVSRQRSIRHAALIGILWGLGHTITIFLVGSAIILFGVVIPPKLGLTMELSVGLMLILLGVLNLTGFTRWITETFTPQSPRCSQVTRTSIRMRIPTSRAISSTPIRTITNRKNTGTPKRPRPWAGWIESLANSVSIKPCGLSRSGLVHGLAGSAAVALLVLTTIRDPRWAIAYLLVFGVGTIAGMMLITAAIALPFKYSQSRFARLNRGLALASGIISIAFGIFIVYQMGYVNGIFTNHPHWTPE